MSYKQLILILLGLLILYIIFYFIIHLQVNKEGLRIIETYYKRGYDKPNRVFKNLYFDYKPNITTGQPKSNSTL